MVTWNGLTQGSDASGVLHSPSWLLPALGRATALSALLPTGAPARSTHSDLPAHTCAHAPSPRLCTRRVPRRTEPSSVYTSAPPTPIHV